MEEGEAALLLVRKVWLCREASVQEVSWESRWKVLVRNQRCSVALTWLGLVDGGGGGGNQVFCERRRDTSEWNHPLLGPNLLFYFPFSHFWRCWRLLIQLDCDFQRVFFKASVRSPTGQEVQRWLTSSKISNDADGKTVDDPEEAHHVLDVFLPCEGSVLGMELKWKTPCILYCLLLPFVFYCQLDLQWENYTMLVFLFYYASVFDFPKYKKLYIALCHRKRMPASLKCQKFPSETDRYDPKLVWVPAFRCFDTPVSETSQKAPRHGNARLLQTNWNTGKCKNMY